LNSHLMASCVGNIRTKNYKNLLIGFQVAVENVRDVFFETQYSSSSSSSNNSSSRRFDDVLYNLINP